MKAEETTEGLKQRFVQYSKHGPRLDKAVQTVLARGVKEHLFLPSERRIYTVVGTLGDEFIDPERPYCSCSDFFFKALGRKDELCYHLLSYMIASESKQLDTVTFSDEEYDSMMAAIIKDVFHILDISSGP